MGMFNNVMMHGQVAWRWFNHKDGRRNVHLDPTQHAMVVIDAEHHEVHEGHMRHISGYDTDVDILTPVVLIATTPSQDYYVDGGYGPYIHFSGLVTVSAQCVIETYEGVTDIVGGTTITTINRNRNSDAVCSCTWVQDPTSYSTASATVLSDQLLGQTGNPQQQVGGSGRSGQEWVFKGETSYAFVITPSQDNTTVAWDIDYYGHYHKDNWDEEAIT